MSVRVYLPSTVEQLREVVGSGGVGPAPLLGHAVTQALRTAFVEGGEEEWEYAALTAAAQDSLALLGEDDPPRRVVLAVDVDTVSVLGAPDLTLVELHDAVPARLIAAVHMDSEDAEPAVGAAAALWVRSEAGDPEATEVVDRALQHELGWYATQEIPDLLG